MESQIENIPVYIVRMTRLEAARALVDPKDLQGSLRSLLAPGDEPGTIEGKVIARALPSGNGHHTATPTVRRKMRHYRTSTRRVACPHCPKTMRPRGLNVHIARMHRGVAPVAEAVAE